MTTPTAGEAQDAVDAGYPAGTSTPAPTAQPGTTVKPEKALTPGTGEPTMAWHGQPGTATADDGKQSELDKLMEAAGLDEKQLKKLLGQTGGLSEKDKLEAQYRSKLFSTYFKLWGENAPPGVIDTAMKEGLNVFQFEDQIRQEPSFKRSETYQNEMADNALSLARMLGVIPG